MREVEKALQFPLAGVSRRGSYRQAIRPPFMAPWAVNVRTVGVSELRRRGGSRPGLVKHCETKLGTAVTSLFPVTYIDSGGTRRDDLVYVADLTLGYVRGGVATVQTAELEGPDGVDILDDNSQTIDFSAVVTTASLQGAVRGGRVYLADDVLRSYDPATGIVEPVVASAGSVPAAEPIVAVYRDRIFLAGLTQVYYASRVSDPTDWDYGATMEDTGAAVAGQLSGAGQHGQVITAMIPVNDQAMVMATCNTLWLLRGDPITGRLEQVSDSVGVVSQDAWAISPDGTLVFLSNDGLYVWQAGTNQAPVRFSAERVPDELREVSTSLNVFSMAYDVRFRGFHLFMTTSAGPSYHWWIDLDNRALWPQRFRRSHEPYAAAALTSSTGFGDVVVASRDGYLRNFDEDATDDDGFPFQSHVLIGPVQLQASDTRDAVLAEIHGALEGVSPAGENVTWRVVTGPSAAEAAEAAYDDVADVLDGLEPSRASASGSWVEGRNKVQRPRARGAWVVVWLSATAAWSYEAATLVMRQLGRHR